MAEIRIEPEPKRGLGWLWALLLVLIIAAVVWYLWSTGYIGAGGRPRSDTTRTSLHTGRMLLGSMRSPSPLARLAG